MSLEEVQVGIPLYGPLAQLGPAGSRRKRSFCPDGRAQQESKPWAVSEDTTSELYSETLTGAALQGWTYEFRRSTSWNASIWALSSAG